MGTLDETHARSEKRSPKNKLNRKIMRKIIFVILMVLSSIGIFTSCNNEMTEEVVLKPKPSFQINQESGKKGIFRPSDIDCENKSYTINCDPDPNIWCFYVTKDGDFWTPSDPLEDCTVVVKYGLVEHSNNGNGEVEHDLLGSIISAEFSFIDGSTFVWENNQGQITGPWFDSFFPQIVL